MAAWLAKEDVPWGRMNEWKAGAEGGRNRNQHVRGGGEEKRKEGWKRVNTVETGRFLAGGGILTTGESRRVGHSQHHPESREAYQLREEEEPLMQPSSPLLPFGNRDGGPKLRALYSSHALLLHG